ncbi:M56 family metallopeptidase [Qipengyuania sphaerica]|uniref:M56 family metallopeptidase n=1 Tax=Qipengyuania sphaerica TaxID=2867243 RepID=UPI001C88C565|nr:M56 family metallopeptidase [Qipengyuania sphaerica]MBX7540513.1 hypothetical protein [Qipengyuania sphaerica]
MIDLLREYWDWFLFDTLLWTGALIGLVMLLRRPVARHFGAGAAYALWFLPLARLVIPPFTLPSWMRPLARTAQELEPVFALENEAVAMPVAMPEMGEPILVVAPEPSIDFLTPFLLLWLGGAAVFLVRRFWLYFALRRELLENARPVGEVGTIRLIETPAISGPMAFGVIDRVIALPEGFMTSRDRFQRDLAIEHELSHHRGGDLLVNMAVQPLFAVHWFNPLGYLGWQALRRDQEAFCDARVVAARPREERAAYAGIIADFARLSPRTPRPALAAPMACPVLGDKSIIHRLRSLSMTDISPRRRLLGRGALASAFLAVPLTASICYAEGAPSVLVAAAHAAEPDVDEWTEEDLDQQEQELAEAEVEMERAFEEAREDFAEAEDELDEAREEIREIRAELARGEDGKLVRRKISYNGKGWDEMTPEQRRKFEAEMEKLEANFAEDGEMRVQMRRMSREFAEGGAKHREIKVAMAEARAAHAHAVAVAPKVVEECRDEYQPVITERGDDGRMVMYVCESAGEKIALRAIRQARTAIASSPSIPPEDRAEALRELDREIAELERKQ